MLLQAFNMSTTASYLSCTFFAQNRAFDIQRIFGDFCDVGNWQPRIHRGFSRSAVIKGVNMSFDTGRSTHRANLSVAKYNTPVQISCTFLFAKHAKRVYFAMSGWVIVGILSIVGSYEDIALHVSNDRRDRNITFVDCYFCFLLAQFHDLSGAFGANIWLHIIILSSEQQHSAKQESGIKLFLLKKSTILSVDSMKIHSRTSGIGI